LDLYRIEDESELPELGLEEAFAGDAIVAVEWPERAPSLIPPGARSVDIQGAGDQPRTVRIR
jgi:tRNA threonylcarbamoyladenosine biosynthesis protein TsaE